MHVILTGEKDAYYIDYAEAARVRTAGAMPGRRASPIRVSRRPFRSGKIRGRKAGKYVPLVGFINFMQNHDQAGNRPFGERMTSN